MSGFLGPAVFGFKALPPGLPLRSEGRRLQGFSPDDCWFSLCTYMLYIYIYIYIYLFVYICIYKVRIRYIAATYIYTYMFRKMKHMNIQ